MLIDTFAEDSLAVLTARAADLPPSHHLYLLVDGAFVPGLHKLLREDAKAILFESLPGCNDETRDASPFLTPLSLPDKTVVRLLKRCDGWPMVSAIETTETLRELAERLAAWCVVEADGQRFNFRFADTRRLPAIFNTLSALQRASFAGPAVRWSYVARDGRWRELEIDGASAEIATEPVLDQRQFSVLVDDSRVDEVMVRLADRGNAMHAHPSRSHALLISAIRAADAAKLDDQRLLDWCEWYWRNDALQDESATALSLNVWRKATC
jgi:hypothetical protein